MAILALVSSCGGGSSGGKNKSAPPTFGLTFEAPGGSAFASGQVNGLKYSPLVLQDFSLANGIVVTGQVTDDLGAPLVGVDVEFRKNSWAPPLEEDTTDGTGNYSVALSPDTWVVTLKSGSNVLGDMTVNGVVVGTPGPVTQDFQFPATVPVTGSVFEMGGPAIGAAQLDFEGQQTGATVSVVANGAGFYTANLVPDTYEAVVTPAGPSALTQLMQRFPSIVVATPMLRNFNLTAGVVVSGTVLDNVGAPLLEATDIEVKLGPSSNFFEPLPVQASDIDGSYTISLVPPESVTLELEPPGDSGFPRRQVSALIVGPVVQTMDPQLALGYVLSGTILNADLTPADVDVEPEPLNGSLAPDDDGTDGAGFYEISLFAGTYDVLLSPNDPADLQLPEIRRITVSGPATLDVTLTLGVVVTGTVTQPGGVIPEPDVRVEIPGVLGASGVTDGIGVYSFLAPVGTHTLDLTAENGFFEDMALDSVQGVVVALPGPVNQDIEMQLSTTGARVVLGTVHEPDGTTPLAGVVVTARNTKTGKTKGIAISAVDGTYILVML